MFSVAARAWYRIGTPSPRFHRCLRRSFTTQQQHNTNHAAQLEQHTASSNMLRRRSSSSPLNDAFASLQKLRRQQRVNEPPAAGSTEETTSQQHLTQQRLSKVLARLGYGSRRECEGLLCTKRVTVNGQPTEGVGTLVSANDVVKVDGEKVPVESALEQNGTVKINSKVFLVHKLPNELVTRSDPGVCAYNRTCPYS